MIYIVYIKQDPGYCNQLCSTYGSSQNTPLKQLVHIMWFITVYGIYIIILCLFLKQKEYNSHTMLYIFRMIINR